MYVSTRSYIHTYIHTVVQAARDAHGGEAVDYDEQWNDIYWYSPWITASREMEVGYSADKFSPFDRDLNSAIAHIPEQSCFVVALPESQTIDVWSTVASTAYRLLRSMPHVGGGCLVDGMGWGEKTRDSRQRSVLCWCPNQKWLAYDCCMYDNGTRESYKFGEWSIALCEFATGKLVHRLVPPAQTWRQAFTALVYLPGGVPNDSLTEERPAPDSRAAAAPASSLCDRLVALYPACVVVWALSGPCRFQRIAYFNTHRFVSFARAVANSPFILLGPAPRILAVTPKQPAHSPLNELAEPLHTFIPQPRPIDEATAAPVQWQAREFDFGVKNADQSVLDACVLPVDERHPRAPGCVAVLRCDRNEFAKAHAAVYVDVYCASDAFREPVARATKPLGWLTLSEYRAGRGRALFAVTHNSVAIKGLWLAPPPSVALAKQPIGNPPSILLASGSTTMSSAAWRQLKAQQLEAQVQKDVAVGVAKRDRVLWDWSVGEVTGVMECDDVGEWLVVRE
jgi:hypothetical protein